MKYFYDCEFIEGGQRLRKTYLEALLSPKIYTEPTIDLISIGFVCENGEKYYAISKDFNFDEAWSREWIRENVLRSIWNELSSFHISNQVHRYFGTPIPNSRWLEFNYKNLKWLIKKYGKTNHRIAQEIKDFVRDQGDHTNTMVDPKASKKYGYTVCDYRFNDDIEFYGYYSGYDHVCLCWLFGKMEHLPIGFPMYTRDLKQTFDELNKDRKIPLKNLKYYPNQPNEEHNALSDAEWNFELYKFLETVKQYDVNKRTIGETSAIE